MSPVLVDALDRRMDALTCLFRKNTSALDFGFNDD